MEILSLYDETLFVDNKEVDKTKLLGTFNKKICVVLRDTEYTEQNLATLQKILQSCGLAQSDCYIYPAAAVELGDIVWRLITELRPSKLIAFDVPVQSSTMTMLTEIYAVKKIGNLEIILSHGFAGLAQDANYKKHLWLALKKMFGID
jgi:hypothetical protein